jgi:hypothetical protein
MALASDVVRLPCTDIDVGNGERIEELGLVEFRLLYDGELPSTGNKGRPSEVHAIRRTFHPQLRRLCNADTNLRDLAMSAYPDDPRPILERKTLLTEQEKVDIGIRSIGIAWNRAGFDWVPLVTPKMALRCSIDILLLRPDIEEKFIFRRGDIDGQVKTVFDALRIPENSDEAGGATPQNGETPFFVLLQDDRLVTEVRVTTDRLLQLPNKPDVKPNDCFAVIHIKLNHRHARTFDNWFG